MPMAFGMNLEELEKYLKAKKERKEWLESTDDDEEFEDDKENAKKS